MKNIHNVDGIQFKIEDTLEKYNIRENFEKDYSMFAKLRKLVGDVISKAKK